MLLPSPPTGNSIRGRLHWRVVPEIFSGDTLQVVTRPSERVHSIYIPATVSRGEAELRWMELEHEYAHCLLAETISPLFSGTPFAHGTPSHLLEALAPACRSATDWYVDGLLYREWPREGLAEIEEMCRLLLRWPKGGAIPPEHAWPAVLGYAQLIHYGGHKGLAKRMRRAIPELDTLAKATFLRYPPEEPLVEGLVGLINAILKRATQPPLRVRAIREGDEVVLYIEG